ncbi:ATP-binding protein [Pseudooceanicola marinus]|uniref:hybrid sensor histidine kinase/response regulator n=1 Tax=Pseudooceanicola marinus TaxID=396013 RepID=UPI001CD2EC87|nr:ATP-binding protein [Pseudooceanicola marinus]MCA1334507.1 response regulator [Pseudooceanicola marinus]
MAPRSAPKETQSGTAAEAPRASLDAGVIRLAVLAAITALCLVVIVYLLTEVRQKLDELASSPADNMQWSLAQLEVEYLKLQDATSRARLAELTRDPGTPIARETEGDVSGSAGQIQSLPSALRELRRRYDILYARFETLGTAPLYNRALRHPALGGTFDRIRTEVYALAPLIDGNDPALTEALAVLDARLEDMRPDLRRMLSMANLRLVAQSDTARLDVLSVLKGLAAASLVLLAALTAMVVLFRSLARVSQKRLEQKRVASARLETIFSTSRDAILMLDSRGRIIDTNRAAAEMFAISTERVIGQPVGRLLRRDGTDGSTAISGRALFDACAVGPRTGYRLIARRCDGQRIPVELSMDSSDSQGAPILVCVIRDISHQVAAEAELKASRDKALAAERAKARFLGVISHEMRTPLNGILGAIDLMAENDDPAEGRRFLEVVRGSAQTLLQLVNDVLDITQIEGGDVAIRRAPFDLDALIDDILASEMPRARAQDNRLVRIGAGPSGWVSGDATRLRQVLLNLVSNAVKFTRFGSISVEPRRQADQVEILVRDTGIGMTMEEAARVFDDFVRLDGAIRHQIQGTGLGLGIARQLARAMGGDIEVASAPGKGSVFTLSLPLPAATPPAGPTTSDTEPAPRQAPPQQILLVEDNATNRFVARRLLERDGHRVTEAANGREGVAAAAEAAFDIILMDVSMPVMDGFEAAAAIRAAPGPNRSTRIVALTAHVGEEVTERLRAAGLDDVVAKPIRAQVIRRLLADHQGARGPSRRLTLPQEAPRPGRPTAPPDNATEG